MKTVNFFVLTFLLVLTGVSLMPSGTGAWAGAEDMTPTAKASAPFNPALLRNLLTAGSGTGNNTLSLSLDPCNFPRIKMTVTVQDATGVYIHNLTLNDFMVREQSNLEDSPTVENIESVTETREDSGVSLGFVFDISESMTQPLNQAKQAAICLIQLMKTIDRAMLMSFSGPGTATELLPPGSATKDANGNGTYDIIEAINSMTASKSTALYDAMAAAITAMGAEDQPKAILLFSDGLANSDQTYDINDAVQMAINAGIPVYTFIYGDIQQNLLNIADATGGLAFTAPTCQDMNTLYTQLAGNMASIYSIIYTSHNPAEDGTTRTVSLTYDGAARNATYTAPDSGQPSGCTKDCGGGKGCFIESMGSPGKATPWTIPAGLFAVLAIVGLLAACRKRSAAKKTAGVVLAMFVLTLSGITVISAQAGLRKGAMSVSALGGLYYFDDDQEIEKDAIGGLGLGYQWADNWGVELMVNYGQHDFHYLSPAQCACLTDDVSATLGRIDLLYHLWPDRDLVPYLAVGFGGISLDFDSFDKEDDAFADYGGGVQYFLSEDFALRADVRGIYTFDDSYKNLAATIGVSFLFGGKGGKGVPRQTGAGVEYTRPVSPVEGVTTGEGIMAPVAAGVKADVFRILFAFNRSDINPAYYDNFKQVADYLHSYQQIFLRIEGHTDAVGNESYNQALSLRRARSVGEYLSAKFGIPQSRMYVVGFGESKPAADNATAAGRRLNRRAELKYMTAVSAPASTDVDLRFEFDKTDINPGLHGKLQQVADYLHSYQDIVVGVAGYTDTYGPDAYNLDLSLRRALSVGDYLSHQFNIPLSQQQFAGLGESGPVASNATVKGRRANRRAELKFFKIME